MDLQEFVNKILAAMPTLLDRAREVVTAAERVPGMAEELERVRAENGVIESNALATLAPLGAGMDELRRMLWPEAERNPDVTPVTAIEDVPGVLDGTLDPGAVDGRTDAGDPPAQADGAMNPPAE